MTTSTVTGPGAQFLEQDLWILSLCFYSYHLLVPDAHELDSAVPISPFVKCGNNTYDNQDILLNTLCLAFRRPGDDRVHLILKRMNWAMISSLVY